MTKCKVAVVGAGKMANEHIRAFGSQRRADIRGIHSRTRPRASELARRNGIPAVCDSIGELYQQTHADLVVVAVNETSLNPVSRACFEFPWTVFLEKPPGYNLADGQEILAAASAAGRNVLVGLNRRFMSSTQAALRDLDPRPGTRFIHVQDQQDMAAAESLGHPAEVVENWMYANSIHLIDYLTLFGRGTVASVTPVVPWSNGDSHVVVAKIEFESGDIGLYEGLWNGPGPWAVSVATHDMRWEMRPLESAAFQPRGDRRLHPVEVDERDREFKPGFRLQAEMAMAAAMGEPSESPVLPEGMETMSLIDAIFGS